MFAQDSKQISFVIKVFFWVLSFVELTYSFNVGLDDLEPGLGGKLVKYVGTHN